MSPATRRDGERATFTITNDGVRGTFDAFVAALMMGDYQTLHDLYDNGYLLIRPDGTVPSERLASTPQALPRGARVYAMAVSGEIPSLRQVRGNNSACF